MMDIRTVLILCVDLQNMHEKAYNFSTVRMFFVNILHYMPKCYSLCQSIETKMGNIVEYICHMKM